MAELSGGFFLLLAAMLLLLPLPWLLAAVLAAVYHELWHYMAIRLLTREKASVHVFSFGARMPIPPMHRSKELICALAGPLGGLSLLLFAKYMPRTAICAAFQSLYNLLPVYPLDGGRALACLFSILFPPPLAKRALQLTEKWTLVAIGAVAVYGSLALKLGLFPMLTAGFLFLRVKIAKMPCKPGCKRVQ